MKCKRDMLGQGALNSLSLSPLFDPPPPGLNPRRYVKLVVKSRHIVAEINKAIRGNLLRRDLNKDCTWGKCGD